MAIIIPHNLGNFEGPGKIAEGIYGTNEAISMFNRVMSNIIGLLTIIAGLFFVFLFLTGAVSWLTAGGDKAQTEGAQKRITSGLIGLVLVIASIFIVDLLGTLLGINILNPGEWVRTVWPGV